MHEITDINKFAANKLKDLRVKNNLTQEQLAEKLNVTQQQIARYETNKRKFKQDFLFQLADYFKVSINYFFPEICSFISDELSDEMGTKRISNSQLSILSGLPLNEIKNILSGEEKLPKPSSLIKLANALETDVNEELVIDFFMSAGYIEDPNDVENELYNSGIRYLLPKNERYILCKYLSAHWNQGQNKHAYNTKEIYDAVFDEEKEEFSQEEVRYIIYERNNDVWHDTLKKYKEIDSITNKNVLNTLVPNDMINNALKYYEKYSALSDEDKELVNTIIETRIKKNQEK